MRSKGNTWGQGQSEELQESTREAGGGKAAPPTGSPTGGTPVSDPVWIQHPFSRVRGGGAKED